MIDLWLVLCITFFYKGNNAIYFKLFLQEKQVSIYATTHSLGQFDEKKDQMKFFEVLKFWGKRLQGRSFF